MTNLTLFFVILAIGLVSLIVTFIVFKYLQSHAEGKGVFGNQTIRYGGALAGYVVVFSLLFGAFYSLSQDLNVQTEVSIEGKWNITLITSKDEIRKGTADITQENQSPFFTISGLVDNPDPKRKPLSFISPVGVIKEKIVQFIYETHHEGGTERGIAKGIVQKNRPMEFFLTYEDLMYHDNNDDPLGRIEFSRM